MWNDFSDYELCEIAGSYGLEDELVFCPDLTLANRERIEQLLTDVEFSMAFSVLDEKQEIAYN